MCPVFQTISKWAVIDRDSRELAGVNKLKLAPGGND
jgi:hypothetical protein